MPQSHEEVLQAVLELQDAQELSIIKLSEPVSRVHNQTSERTSDVSADAFRNQTPASLEADLTHYKVLYICIIEGCLLNLL